MATVQNSLNYSAILREAVCKLRNTCSHCHLFFGQWAYGPTNNLNCRVRIPTDEVPTQRRVLRKETASANSTAISLAINEACIYINNKIHMPVKFICFSPQFHALHAAQPGQVACHATHCESTSLPLTHCTAKSGGPKHLKKQIVLNCIVYFYNNIGWLQRLSFDFPYRN